jgi:hypothetical protein
MACALAYMSPVTPPTAFLVSIGAVRIWDIKVFARSPTSQATAGWARQATKHTKNWFS